jgi:hypothetical protein
MRGKKLAKLILEYNNNDYVEKIEGMIASKTKELCSVLLDHHNSMHKLCRSYEDAGKLIERSDVIHIHDYFIDSLESIGIKYSDLTHFESKK